MTRKSGNPVHLWKFYYWPIVWLFVFLPGFIWPILLEGAWLVAARIAGVVLLIYALFLTSTGGRVLARLGHQEAHETFWPDKFTEFGIFKFMRHPMHLGLALFPLAIALISGMALPIAGAGWGVTGALWFVLQIEEKDNLKKFGQVYCNYAQKVPPFSISLKCLKAGMEIWRLKS
ncbi:MAG: isoprenylcysteine carboxylmethyltransferase family protein [Calditrichaceae bacterium]